MKPRPFYRWKNFWLGLCVLVFLGWASFESRGTTTRVVFQKATSGFYELAREDCATFLVNGRWGHRITPMPPLIFGYKVWAGPWATGYEDTLLPDWPRVKLPDSWIISGFVFLWSTWLFYHWKREQKKCP
ncbi:hypothetical protein OKA05_00510 [Luteolibacter arcticus]|uniref:Uncharacterized protein n=1 Tax=Luteolibacter arcticus TaxID=1581411 RepID=A0ABT3GBL2_9BACT|nr:hypothetical protein [Luteolibacter arcticus]MCW1921014.1 hypothetical protein [Luteolibacter arcticus]